MFILKRVKNILYPVPSLTNINLIIVILKSWFIINYSFIKIKIKKWSILNFKIEKIDSLKKIVISLEKLR